MSTDIKLKRSAVPGKQPNTSILELGEVAINTYDGKMFFKKDDGTEAIVTLLEVTEDNLAIDSSNLVNSAASTLANVLDDLDSAITTAAAGGLTTVSSDATLSGDGTSGSPLSVVNNGHSHTVSNITDFGSSVNTAIDNRVTQSFVNALNVDADLLDGANGTFYLDYNNFTNTPTIPQSGVDFDPVGTDNSTDVTLTGSYDYLTIAGQQITLNQVDYNTDISNLPTLYTSNDANTDIHTIVDKAFVDALNVDADTLDGANSTFFLDYTNFTNTPSIPQSGVDFDPVGTDNSTDVTLAGSYDYLTIAGQQITLGQIDYTTDISNLPTLYTTADANNDIDARVTQSFVNALNVTAAGVQANSVTLGTDTTGDYVASATGGTGVTITGGTGEGSTPSIAIGQDVSTTANVTFQNGTFTGDIQIDGDFTVSGNVVTINVQELAVEDNLIYLNANSAQTNPDLGWAGSYNDGTYAHAGIFRDASDGVFKVFDSYTPEPDASAFIDTTHVSFSLADFQAENFIGTLQGNANTATALATSRSIILTGDASGTASFDGTANASITVVVANDSHNHTVSTITDYGTATNTAIDNRVTKSFVDALNVDADTLDGANSAYFLDFANFANVPDPTIDVTLSGDVSGSGSATLTDLANGSITITTTIQANSVTLGTDTVGDYVESLVSGTGVTITNNSGEGATPTIEIGQDVSTTANVEFNYVTVGGALTVENGGITLLANNKISGVLTPTADNDAANKKYVDDSIQSSSGTDTVLISANAASYTANTGQTVFALPESAYDENHIFVAINGIHQHANTYTHDSQNDTITLDAGATAGDNIDIRVFTRRDNDVITSFITTDTFTANGTQTAFTTSQNIAADAFALVFINGVKQYYSEYSTLSNVVTFDTAPTSGDEVEIKVFSSEVTDSNGNSLGALVDSKFFKGDGTIDTFSFDDINVDEESFLISINGVRQDPSTYTVNKSTNIVTLDAAPTVGQTVELLLIQGIPAGDGVALVSSQALVERSTTIVANTATIVDSFNATTYRSAKFIIQLSYNNTDFEFSEVNVIHDGTSTYVAQYGTVNNNGTLGTVSAQVSGGNVNLIITPAQGDTKVRLIRTSVAE